MACGASCAVCPGGPNGSKPACISGACDFDPLVVVASPASFLAGALTVGDRDIFWISADRKTIYQAHKDGTTAPTIFATLGPTAGTIDQIRAWKTELVWGTKDKVYRTSQDAPGQVNPSVLYDASAVANRRAIGWDVGGGQFAVGDYTFADTLPGQIQLRSRSIRTTDLTSGSTQQLFSVGGGEVINGQPNSQLGSAIVAGQNHVCLALGESFPGGGLCGPNSGASAAGTIASTDFRLALVGPQFVLMQVSATGSAALPKRANLPSGSPVDIPIAGLDITKGQRFGAGAITPQGFVGVVTQQATVKREGLWNVTWAGATTVLWPNSLGAPTGVAADDTYAYAYDGVGIHILRFKLR
jgi:hypothetical protein